MKNSIKAKIVIGLAALAGAVAADIPGLFVIQEARILNTGSVGSSSTDKFGNSGIKWIGDIDNDGVRDLIAGAPNSVNDTGSLVLIPLQKDGTAKSSPIVISPANPILNPLMSKANVNERFGTGVEVIQEMSSSQCGVVVTSSIGQAKIWAIRLCMENGSVRVDAANVFTSFTGFASLRIGEAFQVIDTMPMPAAERLLAIGVPSEASYTGKVALLTIKPSDLTMALVSTLPETTDPTDPIGSIIAANSYFGRSIARIGKSGGVLHLAITASGDLINTVAIGRLHFVDIDVATHKRTQSSASVISVGADTVIQPNSIAAADFDHDGITDLVLGQPMANYATFSQIGAFTVATMKSGTEFKALKQFGKNLGGIVDAGGALSSNSFYGANVLTGDFDEDKMMDVVVGCRVKGAAAGSIWPLRMKAKPWVHKSSATISVSKDTAKIMLSDYVTGNALTWSVSEINAPITGSLTNCTAVRQTGSGPEFDCNGLGTNGTSTWKVTATDHGNPTGETFSEDITFTIKVVGSNLPPNRKQLLPDTLKLREDQPDTAAINFSSYYDDPDGTAATLVYSVSDLNKSTDGLIKFSVAGNLLRVSGVPYKFGVCSLLVNVTDAIQATIRDTIVIKLTHANHAPKPIDTAYSIVESTPTNAVVRVVEYDQNDANTGSIEIAPKHGKATMQGNAVLFVPDSFYLGADSLQYKSTDKAGATGLAMVRFTMTKTSATAKVYKSLKDLAIDEDSPQQVLKVDSLFFSGADRFAVPERDVVTTCMNLKIADVSLDRINHKLSIKPYPNAAGPCNIRIQTAADSAVGTTMALVVKAILDPYHFNPDTLRPTVLYGTTLSVPLDSVDADIDTLQYKALDALPDWIQIVGYHIVYQPTAESQAGMFHLEVRKKALPNVTFLDPTDTLTVLAVPTSLSGIGRRIGQGVVFSTLNGRIEFCAGAKPINVSLISIKGQVLAAASASEHERVTFDRTNLPRLVYLRLIEGDRTTNAPLYLYP
jgi:hypothetical protein